MMIEADIEEPWSGASDAEHDWAAIARACAGAAAIVAPTLANPRLAVSILFTSDADVRALNAQWRAKDAATNVLSFPMMTEEALRSLPADGPPEMLGDIALAAETCAREAATIGIALADHASHLLVHGLLHLAGHDHEDEAEAEAMEALETKALASLGIADPYAP